jgi:hypothetical protein
MLRFGQGKPLPTDFSYRGEWVIEHLVFLYRSDDGESIAGDAPRFTASGTSDGRQSIGFDAAQLAAALGIEINEVFAANQNGSLSLLGTNDASDLRGVPAKRYVFGLGKKRAALVIEDHPRESGIA